MSKDTNLFTKKLKYDPKCDAYISIFTHTWNDRVRTDTKATSKEKAKTACDDTETYKLRAEIDRLLEDVQFSKASYSEARSEASERLSKSELVMTRIKDGTLRLEWAKDFDAAASRVTEVEEKIKKALKTEAQRSTDGKGKKPSRGSDFNCFH